MGLMSMMMANDAQQQAAAARLQAQQATAKMEAMAQSHTGPNKTINVVVPPGSKPGGQLEIPHPEGGTFLATVPANVNPGVTIAVSIPAKPRVSPEQLNAAVDALRAEFRHEMDAVHAELAGVNAKLENVQLENAKLIEQLAHAAGAE